MIYFVTYCNLYLATAANEMHFCDYCREMEQWLCESPFQSLLCAILLNGALASSV